MRSSHEGGQPKIYISGPMTGLPNFNYEAFHAAERQLVLEGYKVTNPARNFNGDTTLPREMYMRKDIEQVLEVDMLYMLKGWYNSAGARLERLIAQETGLSIKYQDPLDYLRASAGEEGSFPQEGEKPSASPAEEAIQLVGGERAEAYGHPLEDFECVAGMFKSWYSHKYHKAIDYTAEDHAMLMLFVKAAREANNPKRDNIVDAHGYLICLDKIMQKRKQLDGEKKSNP